MPHIISLYDFTGTMGRPWAEAGWTVHCLDIQHPLQCIETGDVYPDTGGTIWKRKWDRLQGISDTLKTIERICRNERPAMIFGFPVCTDLAGSGARHWEAKAAANPAFQQEATMFAKFVANIADNLRTPYCIENPKGALSRLWRKPDHSFHPCDFGGYIPAHDAAHPIWPDYIPPRDAYRKHTNLWTGNGFIMPEKASVPPVSVSFTKADGSTTSGSPAWGKLGGKSQKTKNIRSATPRGFAKAVFLANHANALSLACSRPSLHTWS